MGSRIQPSTTNLQLSTFGFCHLRSSFAILTHGNRLLVSSFPILGVSFAILGVGKCLRDDGNRRQASGHCAGLCTFWLAMLLDLQEEHQTKGAFEDHGH